MNLNFELTSFSDLLKLLVCGIFLLRLAHHTSVMHEELITFGPLKKSCCPQEWASPACGGVGSVYPRRDGGGAWTGQKDGQLGPCISDEQSLLNLPAEKGAQRAAVLNSVTNAGKTCKSLLLFPALNPPKQTLISRARSQTLSSQWKDSP